MNEATITAEAIHQAAPSSPKPEDRWLWWPGTTALVGVFWLIFLCGLPGSLSFVLIPLVILGTPLAGLSLLISAGVLAANKRFRKAASILLAILFPIFLARPISWTADCLHLALTAGFGLGQLGSTSAKRDGQFAVYDWSVGLAGGPNTFLIRDMTDEIALPVEWRKYPAESEDSIQKICAGSARHLVGHYYVCTF
jgi:hypothetical protein